MTKTDKPVGPTIVSCEVCLKEVPITEATVSEATDYVVHFCGLECYEKWKNQGGKPKEPVAKPGS
jgi:hypothetical protein